MSELSFLLLAWCGAPAETPRLLEKLRNLVREQVAVDPGFVLCVDEEGNSPLHLAAKRSNVEICVFLLNETNVRLDCRNSNGLLAVHELICRGLSARMLPVWRLFLRRMPHRLVLYERFGERGDTLLHTVTRLDVSRRAEFVADLVALGADPLVENDLGESAYAIALAAGAPSAFFLNNYRLNRLAAEKQRLRPEDVGDDAVQCRAIYRERAGAGEPCDGLTTAQRMIAQHAERWWNEGVESVINIVDYVVC